MAESTTARAGWQALAFPLPDEVAADLDRYRRDPFVWRWDGDPADRVLDVTYWCAHRDSWCGYEAHTHHALYGPTKGQRGDDGPLCCWAD